MIFAWLPPEPDPWWRLATVLVMGGALLVIVLFVCLLAYDLLRDHFDPNLHPRQSQVNDRLRRLPPT